MASLSSFLSQGPTGLHQPGSPSDCVEASPSPGPAYLDLHHEQEGNLH